ncbi:MAG: phospho-sugar mutase [Acholeplasmatales bacterium]|nr:phospho-sugar mutase [Acholeplasmatales bacterium]
MNYLEKYDLWIKQKDLDPRIEEELLKMTDQEKKEAFTNDMEFGTGGMRGILGAGTNRLNIYIIRKASYGFGMWLKSQSDNPSAVIAYDNRHYSTEFAKETAKVFASMGIRAYVCKELRPTPYLSFAVRELHATGGVMITASHNTKEYNGYKIYDCEGCQLVPRLADQVIENINSVEDIFSIETEKNPTLINEVAEDVDTKYIEMVKEISLRNDDKNIKVVYTPLHGTGSVFAPKILRQLGYDVVCVEDQMIHDPDFSSVSSANPENKQAFDKAIALGKEAKADILLANDPDADRLGIAPLHNGEYVLLTGNQTAAIVLKYLLENTKQIPENSYLFTTIVSSNLPSKMAEKNGLKVKEVLTGFKFIGEQAKLIEKTGNYFFGFEESYGCLVSDKVRDKDAMQASLIACEACNYYKAQGKTLVDVLNSIYEEYGYYIEGIENIVLKGLDGASKIQQIMDYFRNNDVNVKGIKIKEDYKLQKVYGMNKTIDLPKSNVIKYILDDESWFILRPSGTEPKLKVYFGVKAQTMNLATTRLEQIKKEVLEIINKI